ncbi:MAG: helix-turn-helix domain-containing protein [Proteobacteria bacterium]|nr:helix-turn-helix domain-containing protein [Pseudomonadota bacterium]MBU1058655.1 helix-turn-helix domain-containing protein [Pseudomonadota bacterium]
MSQKNTVEEPPTLGTFIRTHREQKGITLGEATESTKISDRILKAIENDDYDNLPAETFSRGFYTLYAKFLELNPEEILARYLKSRGQQPLSKRVQTKPRTKNRREFSTYAEPVSFSSVSTINFIIVAALIAVAAICWSLNWNPATYISAKLQTLKATPLPQQEQSIKPTPQNLSPTTEVQPATTTR